MLTRKDVMPLNYYKKESFTGSFMGMRFMLGKSEVEDQKFLHVSVWPQPFCFEVTPEEKKIYKDFSFDEAGIVEAVEWLNATYEERREEFEEASRQNGM
ncbi:MAG: hypothetical protein K6F92_01500 [Lachnospiraceae bacterium]|nr:hypothetical protein [Lachnospiraceae bacterium]